MIYPDVDPKEWAERHRIELKDHQCIKCKQFFPCDIPVAMKGYRGFTTATHECGERYAVAVFRPIGEERDWWMGTLPGEP